MLNEKLSRGAPGGDRLERRVMVFYSNLFILFMLILEKLFSVN